MNGGETNDVLAPVGLYASIEVDARVDEGESMVLVAAVEHWGLHHEMFRPSSRNRPARLA